MKVPLLHPTARFDSFALNGAFVRYVLHRFSQGKFFNCSPSLGRRADRRLISRSVLSQGIVQMSSRPFHKSDMSSRRPLTPLSMMCFYTRIICDLCSCLRPGPMFRLVGYGQSMVPCLGRCLVSRPLPLDAFILEAHFFSD